MSKLGVIGIVGAGNMGSGIAQKAAQSRMKVVLVDLNEQLLQKGLESIKKSLTEAVEKKILSQDDAGRALSSVVTTTHIEDLRDVDMVIEAVYEDIAVKQDLFRKLDSICHPRTILATNTSSFRVTDIASATKRPDRCVGLHFFYHPAKNRLLELVPGGKTSAETMSLAKAFSGAIGKTDIAVKDEYGFAVNRFFVPWLNEAVRVLEEGVADIPTIDEAAKKGFGIGMGPFLLMNVTGVPIAFHTASTFGKSFGPFYAPARLLREQADKKTAWDLGTQAPDPSRLGAVQDRLFGAVFLVAAALVAEGVASKEDIDRGARVGLRWSQGPFEMMNAMGVQKAVSLARETAKKHNVKISELLAGQERMGIPWHLRFVDMDIKDGIAFITVNRPDALNALNEDVITQLGEAFSEAESSSSVSAIILRGAGKAFVAGADIAFFVRAIEDKDLDRIVRMTMRGHDLLRRIDTCKKPVLAVLNGVALGGGAELLLAADTVVATDRGSIAFPETGIGIYPGLGGTQRLPRIVGKPLAKLLVLAGEALNADAAHAVGLVEYLCPIDDADATATKLAKSPTLVTKANRKPAAMPEQFKRSADLFADDRVAALLSPDAAKSADPLLAKIGKRISFRAPIAVKLANQLIDDGAKLSLDEALRLELDNLTYIFSTKDAHEGLKSVLERRRPVFKGG
ncbi:MAG: 3-hydroxyacyl-CoA dehydrogenase NAD-binding domain-containing protein [Planctomycetota bacterium]|nr:3-hydroxyacyl-CoA dehydrogenase NAD-binding domain-containing protein [Planctomycetota bacterium]